MHHVKIYEWMYLHIPETPIPRKIQAFARYTYLINRLNRQLSRVERATMPRRKKNNSNDFGGFSPSFIELTADQKKAFEANLAEYEDSLGNDLQILLENEYKVSVSPDFQNDTCIATLTCKNQDDPNYKKFLSARHPEVMKALCLVVYKHIVICEDLTWPEGSVGVQYG